MSDTREYYLFGFFKGMSSENKMSFAIAAFIALFLIICILSLAYVKLHKNDYLANATDCETRVLYMNKDNKSVTRKLLYACKGITIKETCEEMVMNSYFVEELYKKTTMKLLYACRADPIEAEMMLNKLKR